jgi:hypothetical protein
MPYRPVYNSTDAPVVVDPSGRSIGGREHGIADPYFDEVELAVERGDLVYVGDEQSPDATAEAERVNDRRSTLLDDATPSELRRLAELSGLPSAPHHTPTGLAALLAPTTAELSELDPVDDDTAVADDTQEA